jgi:hypothetical protein
MAEMDLNIDNYSVTDLEKFFRFKSKKYIEQDIEEREYEIREQLLSSGHVNKKFKRDLIIFLKSKYIIFKLMFIKFKNTIF